MTNVLRIDAFELSIKISFGDFMAKLNIPAQEIPVLKKISELPDDAFEGLISAFKNIDPALESASVPLKKVEGITNTDAKAIFGTVCSLQRVKSADGIPAEQLAAAISSSAQTQSPELFSSETTAALKSRLTSFLKLDGGVAITGKANDVMTDHQHVFCKARILSDVRPIFEENPNMLSAAVVIHNLQIGYHDNRNGTHKEFYVALDMNDLKQLKAIIERAEKKAVTLESLLQKAEIPYLTP